MKIIIDKKTLIEELAWCLDMVYPLEYKGKVITARISEQNRILIARGITGMLSAYKEAHT